MDGVPYEEWADRITENLKKYGIEDGLVLDLGCGTGSMTELLAGAGYDMIGVDASNMTARALLERFTSTAGDNFINYSDSDYDALFAQVQTAADDDARTELYKEMERNLTEHAANVYIQDLADLVVLRNGLEGYQFYPIYVMDLSTVHYTA